MGVDTSAHEQVCARRDRSAHLHWSKWLEEVGIRMLVPGNLVEDGEATDSAAPGMNLPNRVGPDLWI